MPAELYELTTLSGDDLAVVRRSFVQTLGFYTLPTLAALTAADIPAEVHELVVLGVRTPGDAGPSMTMRRTNGPVTSHKGWQRSADRYKLDQGVIINSDFSDPDVSHVTLSGASVSGGVLNVTGGGGFYTFFEQAAALTSGVEYNFSLDYNTYTTSSRLSILTEAGTDVFLSAPLTVDGVTHRLTGSFVANGTTFKLRGSGAYFIGTIDNLTVVPVAGAAVSPVGGGYWEYVSRNQPIYIEWFGGRGDMWAGGVLNSAATDNVTPLLDASRFLDYHNIGVSGSAAGPTIQLGYGAYYMSDTITFDRAVCLHGMGHAAYHDAAQTRVVFAAGKAGFIFSGLISGTGSPSILRNVFIDSLGKAGQTTKHGVDMNVTIRVEGCSIRGFGGNGVNIYADIAGGTNANCWHLFDCWIYDNAGHGVHTQAGDSNAGIGYYLSLVGNGGYGIYDYSFLGNTYIGCHTAGNLTGAYFAYGGNAPTVFLGCYSESDQPASWGGGLVTFIGGLHGSGIDFNGCALIRGKDYTGGMRSANGNAIFATSLELNSAYTFNVDGGNVYSWTNFGSYWALQWANSRHGYGVVGEGNFSGGRLAANTGHSGDLLALAGMYLGGDHTTTPDATRRFGLANAMPTVGSFAAGEVRLKDNGAGGYACTTSGFMGYTWTSGTFYFAGTYAKAPNAHWYRTNNANATATVAPTHTSGTVTGADGLAWEHLGTENAVWREFAWPFI